MSWPSLLIKKVVHAKEKIGLKNRINKKDSRFIKKIMNKFHDSFYDLYKNYMNGFFNILKAGRYLFYDDQFSILLNSFSLHFT